MGAGCGCNGGGAGGAGAGYTGRPYRAAVLAASGKQDAASTAKPRSRWLQWVIVGTLAYLVIR